MAEQSVPSERRYASVRFAAAVALSVVALALNNVTFSGAHLGVVVSALGCASLSLALTVSVWSQRSLFGRVVLMLFALGALQTLADAGGRRFPSILHW